jgi:hypothetical protein
LKPLRSFSGAASMPRHMPHAGLRHYRHTLATSYTPPHATCRDVITPLSPMPVTLHCHDVRSQPLIAPDKPYAACQTATSPHCHTSHYCHATCQTLRRATWPHTRHCQPHAATLPHATLPHWLSMRFHTAIRQSYIAILAITRHMPHCHMPYDPMLS